MDIGHAKTLLIDAADECGLTAAGIEIIGPTEYAPFKGSGVAFLFSRSSHESQADVSREVNQGRFVVIQSKLNQAGILVTWQRLNTGEPFLRITCDPVNASKVYHVTHQSRVPAIDKDGLKPGRLDRPTPSDRMDAVGNVYFAPAMGDVADARGGRTANGTAHRWRSVFAEKRGGSADDYVIYEVDLSLAGLPRLYVDPWSDSGVAIVCPRIEPIPPWCLKLRWREGAVGEDSIA